MSGKDKIGRRFTLTGICIDVTTDKAGRLVADKFTTINVFPVVSSLADRFAITVAPTNACSQDGGIGIHKSSQISMPSINSVMLSA